MWSHRLMALAKASWHPGHSDGTFTSDTWASRALTRMPHCCVLQTMYDSKVGYLVIAQYFFSWKIKSNLSLFISLWCFPVSIQEQKKIILGPLGLLSRLRPWRQGYSLGHFAKMSAVSASGQRWSQEGSRPPLYQLHLSVGLWSTVFLQNKAFFPCDSRGSS